MIGKREAKRADLKDRLVAAARARIEKNGLKGLRARDITADADCALGALYNVFADLDDLILHANYATLMALDATMEAAAQTGDGPEACLRALARAYLQFALDNRNLWNALFEHSLPAGVPTPDWYQAGNAVLFRHVLEPLSVLEPGLSEDMLTTRARTAFAAVHGIVTISLEERFFGLPKDKLAAELDRFVAVQAAGIRALAEA